MTEEEFPQEVVEKAKVGIGAFLDWKTSSRTMLDSNSNSYGMIIPKYNGKGGQHFTMFMMKFKAYAAEKNLSAIMLPGFKATLPDTKGMVLNGTDSGDKIKIKALEMNAEGIHALIMALETPEMMNKIMLEQRRSADWPTGIFLDMWDGILTDE